MAEQRHYMFKIDTGAGIPIAKAVRLLREAGVMLDPEYGAVPLNTSGGVLMLRGHADETALAKAREAGITEIYPDPEVGA